MSQKKRTAIVSVGFCVAPSPEQALQRPPAASARGWKVSDIFMWPLLRDWVVKKYMGTLKYRHCEIAFWPDFFEEGALTQGKLWAYGVMRYNEEMQTGGQVFGKEREFSNPNYQWINLQLPVADALRIYKACQRQVGKAYDYGGGERSVLLPRSNLYSGRWYCANLTVCGLQQAGILTGLNPNGMTVDDIHRYLMREKKVPMRTPYQIQEDRRNDEHDRKRREVYRGGGS